MAKGKYFDNPPASAGSLGRFGNHIVGSPFQRLTMLFFVVLVLTGCGERDPKAQVTAGQLLPGKSDLSGLTLIDSVKSFDRGKVWDYLGQDADRFLYNGFQILWAAQYASSDGSRKLKVDLTQFADPIKAFALYSFYRSPNDKFIDVVTDGCIAKDTLLFYKGAYLGRAVAAYANSESDLIAVAKLVTDRITDTTSALPQLKLFPREGLIPHSETVSLDDIGGPNDQSNLWSADYAIGGDTVTLHFRLNVSEAGMISASSEFVGRQGSITEYLLEAGYQSFIGQNGEKEPVFCALNKGVFCAVTGFADKKIAQQLVKQLFESALPKQTK
jgi:hypothetical protein